VTLKYIYLTLNHWIPTNACNWLKGQLYVNIFVYINRADINVACLSIGSSSMQSIIHDDHWTSPRFMVHKLNKPCFFTNNKSLALVINNTYITHNQLLKCLTINFFKKLTLPNQSNYKYKKSNSMLVIFLVLKGKYNLIISR